MDDLELARVVARAEMGAWADAVRAATPQLSRQLGLAAEPVADGLALVAANVPSVLYNRTFGFGLDAPVDEATLDRAIGLYRRDAPFTIQPSPAARPSEIPRWLEARGLISYVHWVIWVREAGEPAPAETALEIDRVGQAAADIFARLASEIFKDEAALVPWIALTVGRRGWHHYIAREGATQVGIAALYIAGQTGWLGWGGTLPTHRRRGVQSALLARRVRDATALGCRWITVETAPDRPEKPNPSYRNVGRAGFRVLHLRPSHAHVPPEFRPGAEAGRPESSHSPSAGGVTAAPPSMATSWSVAETGESRSRADSWRPKTPGRGLIHFSEESPCSDRPS